MAYARIKLEGPGGTQGIAQATGDTVDDAVCNAALRFMEATGVDGWELVEVLESSDDGLAATIRGHGLRGAGR